MEFPNADPHLAPPVAGLNRLWGTKLGLVPRLSPPGGDGLRAQRLGPPPVEAGCFIKPDSGAQKVELTAGTDCSGFSGLERKALKTRSLGKISDSIKKRSCSPIVDD
ncbi:hypothetical protein PGTUg99_027088 [Puccinia graminis f. sp. tritici]|uniref:Uncharacterized protein n=1 Tax=Puccinia graminis f. sp. tritici TaxID=56615 RepID=A0A5B0S2H0_PUCGR|nr:hypothetical protein PGTUg99_027088 [Puccinia graminis f. sp. tritici]